MWTEDEQRGLALLRKFRTDPVLLVNTLLTKKPHPGQVEWLRNSVQPINTLVPGNRWGKSTVIAMKHISKCVTKHGPMYLTKEEWIRAEYETISVAMSADQALIVYREARRLCQSKVMKPLVRSFRESPFPHIIFQNGAIMHCRSAHDDGKYIDGHEYRYLSIDEAGWISNLKHLMNGVIIMRLAGGGEIDLIGTPKGYNDLYFYYTRGQRGVPGYYSQRGSIFDNPFLPAEDIKMRDALLASADPRVRRQVLEGEFIDSQGLAFSRAQLDQAFDPALPSKQKFRPEHRYVAGWDLARLGDYTVGCVLDITEKPWQLVHFERLNKVAWEEIYARIEKVRDEYHIREPYIDSTGPGGDVIEEELYKRGIGVVGHKSSSKAAKVDLINELQNALDENRHAVGMYEEIDESGLVTEQPLLEAPGEGDWGWLRMPPHVALLDEMGIYSFDDKELMTDCVYGLALAVHAAYETESVQAPVYGGLYG